MKLVAVSILFHSSLQPSYYLANLLSYNQTASHRVTDCCHIRAGKQQVIRKAVLCAVTCVWALVESNFLFALPSCQFLVDNKVFICFSVPGWSLVVKFPPSNILDVLVAV